MSNKITSLVATALVFCATHFANAHSTQGKVFLEDCVTGNPEPLSGVVVTVTGDGTTSSVTTDPNGFYYINGLIDGSYTTTIAVPAGLSVKSPATGNYTFQLGDGTTYFQNADWVLYDPACVEDCDPIKPTTKDCDRDWEDLCFFWFGRCDFDRDFDRRSWGRFDYRKPAYRKSGRATNRRCR